MLPPRWVRRLVLAPGVVLLTVAVLGVLPLAVLVAALASPLLPGRWRPLRVLWMVVVYLLLESAALVVLLTLWVCSGFGWRIRSPRFERAHYDLAQWLLRFLFAECQRVLRVEVSVEGPEPASLTGRPLLVFARHAGPGDSFLIVHALLSWYDREPRIVLKDALQWDPLVDVLLSRLPNRFIRSGGGRRGAPSGVQLVDELASGLDDDDALLVFPEGGNYTDRRRARAIAKLREKGLIEEADKAERMRHVLPPRPGGVSAAIEAAPQADVVWVAHSGLDHVVTVGDMWRALPLDTTIRMRWWLVPADEVPAGAQERGSWLYAWWERIDAWVGEQRDAPARTRSPGSPPLPGATRPG